MGQPQKPLVTEQPILSLGRILQSLREQDNVDALIETTISYLQEQFDYRLVWIALYDRLEHILYGKGGIIPSSDSSYLKQRVVLSPGDLLEQVVIEQRPLGVADLRAESRADGWQEIAAKFNIQGTILLPIRAKDRCLGIVLLGSEHWGYLLNGEDKLRLSIVLGELGAVLHYHQIDALYKQTKRSEEPLLRLLEKLRSTDNLENKLEAVVSATHEFVSPSRTNIYWFEREGRFFWRRVSNLSGKGGKMQIDTQTVGRITVEELSDFYFALSVNNIVSIGEARSSLKSHFTAKLLQRLQVRSLLAAPIIWQKDLLGFLAVEAKEARIWTETERNFVQGAAGYVSLALPTDNIETIIQQVQEDAQLKSQVAQAIYSDEDALEILNGCALKVLDRLSGTRFLLLQHDPDQNKYQIFYQSQPYNRRPLTGAFDALKELDWQLLQHSTEAVGIENLEEDLRFFNWRSLLIENGARSLIVSNCAQAKAPDALLVIVTDNTRSWTTREKELVQVIAQQLSVVIRQWQLYKSTEQQHKILDSFWQCFRILEQAENPTIEGKNHLERTALEQIASVLGCPLAILISWQPGQRHGEIISGVIANTQFAIASDTSIPLYAESLVQWALATDGMLSLKVDDIPADTRKWLFGNSIGQILVMALRTSADYETTGIVIMADHTERQWSEQSLYAIETLICQLAWSRRQQQISQILRSRTEELQQINWYKHRRLEDIQKTTTQLLAQMHGLGIPTSELQQMRYQQLLRQLDSVTASMTGLVKLEQWQLSISQDCIPIASLLKRSLERVDICLKQQKLWVGVHGLGQETGEESSNYSIGPKSTLTVRGDIGKIELVLYELLAAACERSIGSGRIDIWCRRLDQSLEMSITDNGTIEPQLLIELHKDTPKDVLATSTLNHPPGLHLLICQNLMQQQGGELQFYELPDGRVVSRLLLPLCDGN
jgi:GAF domain-containing protein